MPGADGGRIYGRRSRLRLQDAESFAVWPRAAAEAVWVTSNRRTTQTALAILAAAEFAGVSPPVPDSPSSTGRLAGLERKPFYATRGVGTHTLWFAPADERAPGGESFADLVGRVAPAVERLTMEHRGRDIVAVTHGGTIRAALGLALGLDPQAALAFAADNCSLTRLDHLSAGGGTGLWRVVAVNRRPWPRAATAPDLARNAMAIDRA
jgi:broad specificity phosphatase PhoE